MNVRPIRTEEFERVGRWLGEERNARWLDFGGGRRSVDPMGLKIMTQRDLHCLRVYTPPDEDIPVGIVGLSNVDREFGTAEFWCVLGEKAYGAMDLTVPAAARMLEMGFEELGLESIFAWTVAVNERGLRLLERLGFRPIGRRRRCHSMDGRLHDRLLFDLLAEEYDGYAPREREGEAEPAARPAARAEEER